MTKNIIGKKTVKNILNQNLTEKQVDDELKSRNDGNKFETLKVYHSTMSREEADKCLKDNYKKNKINGTFLVRPSGSSQNYVLVIINENECKHYLINHEVDSYFKVQYKDEEQIVKYDPAVNGLDNLIRQYQTEKKSLFCLLSNNFIEGELLPVNVRITSTRNLLHETAAKVNEISKLKFILKSKYCPDINERDEDGRTAIDIACEYDNVEAIKEIIRYNPLMNLKAKDDYNVLHRAAEHNAINSIEYLLSNGYIDPTERLLDNLYVPLHLAVEHDNFMCVKMFLKFNLPDKPRTSSGKTPLDLATDHGFKEIIDILNSYEPKNVKKSIEWLHDESLNRGIAEKILKNAHDEFGDGVFLVRKKTNSLYVISLMYENSFENFEVILVMNKYYCVDDGPYFRSLDHLIDYYMRYQDGFPCKLRSPISPDSVHCRNLPKQESVKGSVRETKKLKRNKLKLDGQKKLTPEKKPKDNLKDIKLENILGEGEFGTVYKATLNHKKQVAVKMLKDFNAFKDFEREAEIMNNIGNHPCIVKIFGIIKEKDKFMIIQELLVCSLLDKLNEKPRVINDYNLKTWSIEIVSGMDHLEQKKIVHRDLAARNILLGSNLQAKISDFGLSRAYEGDEYTQTKDYKIPIKWYAPESIERCRFTSKSDVWSFGIMLWEMWSYGDIPYGDKSGAEVYDFIRDGKRLSKPSKCLNSIFSIMEKCWDWCDETRPTFKNLMEIFKELTNEDKDYSDVKNIYM